LFEGEELVAIFYIAGVEPDLASDSPFAGLVRLGQLLTRSCASGAANADRVEMPIESPADLDTYLEQTPLGDIQRQKLLLLLDRHDWNIARVARLMGITRRTVYLRLRRYGIPRERRYKTRTRGGAFRAARSGSIGGTEERR
jgi:DNA-binding NtrC family response regulator